MSTTRDEPAPSRSSVTERSASDLKGSMGALELIFTVMAYNGPVVVFLSFMPVAILLGNGVGFPSMILLAGVVATMLAVGLIQMTRRLDRPGGFYAVISTGLGRIPGLAAGFAAVACYLVVLLGVYALAGISLGTVVEVLFSGPTISWWIYALAILAATSVLGYFNISFSAKVLTVFLGAELLLMGVYDVAVIAQGGADGLGLDSFTWGQFNSGSVAIGFLFAIGLFGGFEATVIFRDEVRNPQRTIPAATYGVIGLLAVIYGLTAWCFINSYGAGAIMAALTDDLFGAASASVQDYVGGFAFKIATFMLFTSAYALVLASHNITVRYVFNLAVDGILPRGLGRAHPRHVSPHRASVAISVVSLVMLSGLIIAQVPKETIYARLAGMYSYAFLALLVMVSLAIGVFLLRGAERSVAAGVSALVAFCVFAGTLVFATRNFDLLTGAVGGQKVMLLTVFWGIVVLGAVTAAVLRTVRPEVYARIGRQ